MIILLCTGCGSYFYQVYYMDYENPVVHNDCLAGDDGTIRVYYNFWAPEGNGDFFILNTSEKEIFIDLARSHLIRDSIAQTYFPNLEIESSPQITANDININMTLGNATTKTVLTHMPSRIICLPGKSGKFIQGYSLKNQLFKDCKQELFPAYQDIEPMTFDRNSTPLCIRNILTYSFTEDFKEYFIYNDTFWISEIVNMPETEFIESKRVSFCGKETKVHQEVQKFQSPNRFFLKYDDIGFGMDIVKQAD